MLDEVTRIRRGAREPESSKRRLWKNQSTRSVFPPCKMYKYRTDHGELRHKNLPLRIFTRSTRQSRPGGIRGTKKKWNKNEGSAGTQSVYLAPAKVPIKPG